MKKGGVACLVFTESVRASAAELDWLLAPRFLRDLA